MKQTDLDTARTESRMLQKREYRSREIRNWVLSLAIAVIVALTLRFFVFEFIRVDGESMLPTLENNEYVFMERVTYWFSGPKRGDIVICHFPGSPDTYVKRVIGVGGDRLRVTNGVLYINDTANYDYFSGVMNMNMNELTVPEDSVFVMGDNRNNSTDSRMVGALSLDMILGEAVFIIWPLDNIGGI